jgi:hypothetical protein
VMFDGLGREVPLEVLGLSFSPFLNL